MMEAQEMFRTSNKVTRPEKALILGFMAGSRGKFCSCLVTLFYRSSMMCFLNLFFISSVSISILYCLSL